MSKFYFFLWLSWLLRVSLCSVGFATIISLLVSLFIYVNQDMPDLSTEVLSALFTVFKFWFPITLSFSLLIALFRALKYIFNTPTHGYEFKLLECNSQDVLDAIGYGDIVKVWRKWFMLIIWLVTAEIIIAIVFIHFFTSFYGIMEWFNIYYLSIFIFIAGYFSFIILGARCKRVKLVKC